MNKRSYSSAKTTYLGNCTIIGSIMNFELAGFMSLAVWSRFKTLLTLLGRHNFKISKTIITNKNNKLVVWWTWSPAWKWCDYQLWKKHQTLPEYARALIRRISQFSMSNKRDLVYGFAWPLSDGLRLSVLWWRTSVSFIKKANLPLHRSIQVEPPPLFT